jgi:hypothetical protein
VCGGEYGVLVWHGEVEGGEEESGDEYVCVWGDEESLREKVCGEWDGECEGCAGEGVYE